MSAAIQKKKIGDFIIQNQPIQFRFYSSHQFYPTFSENRPSETFLLENYQLKDFLRLEEFRLLKEIKHPNLLKIEDVRTTSNNVYIIYEPFMDDFESLSLFLQKNPGLPLEQVFAIASDVVNAVRELNKVCLIHRGICPNTIIRHQGKWKLAGYETVKYVKDLHDDTKFSHSFQTTDECEQLYLAPELLEQTYGCNCDVYSIGVLLLEMLVGAKNIPKKIKGKFILKEFGLQQKILDMLIPLLNERQKDRTDLKELQKILKNHLKGSDNINLSVESNQKPTESNMHRASRLIDLPIEQSINMNIGYLKGMETKKKSSEINMNFFEYLKILVEILQLKISKIPKICDDLEIPNKNSMIYQLIYLLTRLECAVRKKILTVAQKIDDNSTNFKNDLEISREQVKRMNDLCRDKTKFFRKFVAEFINNEKDELNQNKLDEIRKIFREFIKQIFEGKHGKNKKKGILTFLDNLVWIEERLREEVYGNKEIGEDKLKKYQTRLEKIKSRKEMKEGLSESELKEVIKTYLGE